MKVIWKNTLCMLAGLWLWVSPFILHFKLGSDASSDANIVGIFIGTLSMMAIATSQVWEEWTKVLLGAWLIASPWLLGFSHQSVAAANIVIVGLVVVVLSLWSLARRGAPQQVAT
ncbi:MAG: SPW repeat protein [Gammaproteobacteria bacterium]|jgi:hypothetical protein